VIFQDFVRYDFRFDENIAVGEIETVSASLDAQDEAAAEGATAGESIPSVAEGVAESVVETPAEIVVAAEKSLAASLLPRFPKGYRQMLGRRFEGGVDLSGGEWQKVALARAYMRHAHLLILDEPTAALDARAEYEVFRRFSELVAGRMAVIISHRFSTVRMADRIIVLNAGEMVQQGTHDELAAQPGIYSELFSLQAEGYK
jgi:ATP-binding cassette subfamily B protein